MIKYSEFTKIRDFIAEGIPFVYLKGLTLNFLIVPSTDYTDCLSPFTGWAT